MSRLSDIESAVDALPAAEKQELLLFLAARLRAEAGRLPAPRRFSRAEVDGWVAVDNGPLLGGPGAPTPE